MTFLFRVYHTTLHCFVVHKTISAGIERMKSERDAITIVRRHQDMERSDATRNVTVTTRVVYMCVCMCIGECAAEHAYTHTCVGFRHGHRAKCFRHSFSCEQEAESEESGEDRTLGNASEIGSP